MKSALIFGVANKKSIAWGIAQELFREGVKITLVCQDERYFNKVTPLAEELNAKLLICDVTKSDDIKNVFEQTSNIDYIVHSIAYAPTESISMPLSEVSKNDFLKTMEISVYSLIEITNIGKKYLNENGAILTMTYLGSQRVMSGYNLMGVAKNALEASVRYLSIELGESKKRINAISAGPLKTFSSSVFPNFNQALELVAQKSPLKENITISDVGNLASFLLSSKASKITGAVHYIDSGCHILGS